MLKAFFTFVIFLMLTASLSFNVHQEVFPATKTLKMVRIVQARIDQVYGWLYGIVQAYRGYPLYFRLLGIHPGSSTKKIRSAFRKRSLQAHPDKVYGTLAKIRAEEHFVALNQARDDAFSYVVPPKDDSAQQAEFVTWCLNLGLAIVAFSFALATYREHRLLGQLQEEPVKEEPIRERVVKIDSIRRDRGDLLITGFVVEEGRPVSVFQRMVPYWEEVKAARGQLVPPEGDFGYLPPHALIVKFRAGPLNQMHWVDVSIYPGYYQDTSLRARPFRLFYLLMSYEDDDDSVPLTVRNIILCNIYKKY